jgi:GGDEF domain-containing protein
MSPFLAAIAGRIRAAVEAADCAGHRVTGSIGACESDLVGDVQAALLRLTHDSDACLLQAKQRGRNTVVVSPS